MTHLLFHKTPNLVSSEPGAAQVLSLLPSGEEVLCDVRAPKTRADFDVPLQLLIRLSFKLVPKPIANDGCVLGNIIWRERALISAKICPSFFDLCKFPSMNFLRFNRIARAERESNFCLPD
jgi:hypothetical protein